MKKTILFLSLLALFAVPFAPARAQQPARPARVVTDPASMIAEVNALRVANGLAPYTANPILMGIAQQHAEFMAANGMAHIGYGGTRPFQRALNAGYPLAGDLSLGGFISENITGGTNKSVQQAVIDWQGDAPHLHTMLSTDLREIGAGVAFVGERVFYVIDCARPTGSGQQQDYTPGPGLATSLPPGTVVSFAPLASTIVPSTPQPDGKLYHIVGSGETLWLIAITYGVKIADIRRLNGMAEADAIYPKEKLLVREDAAPVVIASQTPAPSETPTLTSLPTFTSLATLPQTQDSGLPALPSLTAVAPPPSTPVPLPPVTSNMSMAVLGAIVLAALVLAAIFVRSGRRV